MNTRLQMRDTVFARNWQRDAGALQVFRLLKGPECKCKGEFEHTSTLPKLEGAACFGPISVTGKCQNRALRLKQKHTDRLEREASKRKSLTLTRDREDIAERLRIMAAYHTEVSNGRYRIKHSDTFQDDMTLNNVRISDGKNDKGWMIRANALAIETIETEKPKPFTLKWNSTNFDCSIEEIKRLGLFKFGPAYETNEEGKQTLRRGSYKNGYPRRLSFNPSVMSIQLAV